MDEKEVARLTEEVGEVDPHDPAVKGWVRQQMETCRIDEKRLQAAFRLHKFLRNDDEMQRTAKLLADCRNVIRGLTELYGAG